MKAIYVLMAFCLVITACGPSPAELAVTSTRATAEQAATQTAAAPTATPTSTPTSTPTLTFTATQTSTSTPTSTSTSTSTATATPTDTPTPKPTVAAASTRPPTVAAVTGGGIPAIVGVFQIAGDAYSLTLAVQLDGLTLRTAPVSPQDTAGVLYTVVAFSPDDCQAVNCGPFGLEGKFHSDRVILFSVSSSSQ